jgi:uncharacterized protein (TIGR02145 family)
MKTQPLFGSSSLIIREIAFIVFLGFLCSGYSQETGTVTDIDGNTYKTVKIGDQWWMAENLKVTHYRNGDLVPHVTGSEWASLSNGAYCEYENSENYVVDYGRLYNWYAINDSRNIAPAGWHVPSDEEWKLLEIYLGMNQIEANQEANRGIDEGGKLKEAGTTHWFYPNKGATNESGFSALPAGYRDYSGLYRSIGEYAAFWSFTESNIFVAWCRFLGCNYSGVDRGDTGKHNGLSVRCIMDQGSGGIESKSATLKSFELNQNYPNPFNSETIINYNLPLACHVKLTIYNIKGEEIATLLDGHRSPGNHSITWTADNVSNGLYFYQLQAGSTHLMKKMIIQK